MTPEGAPPEPSQPLVSRVFFGPHGLRAGWRFLLYVVLLAVTAELIGGVLHLFTRKFGEEVLIVSVLLATFVMSRIERRPFWLFGFARPHAARYLLTGAATGFLGLSLLMAILIAAGAYHLSGPGLHGSEVWRWAGYWAVAFVMVSLAEELLTRGYALFALSQGIGFWPAAVILSLFFGAGHLGNGGEQTIGIANAVLAGLVFCYSLWWTGSLWWAIGFHMTWDWGESFFYGVADSGSLAPHHYLTGTPNGPAWLSGGTVGPEGSVLAAVVLLLMAAAFRFTTPHTPNPALGRPALQ